LGALGFDSAVFAAARFESGAFDSDEPFDSDDLALLDFESLDFVVPDDAESPEDFESDFDSPPPPLSDPADGAVAPLPFDDVRGRF